MLLWLEKKVEGLEENCPQVCYDKKAMISKQALGHFNKLDLADTFE